MNASVAPPADDGRLSYTVIGGDGDWRRRCWFGVVPARGCSTPYDPGA